MYTTRFAFLGALAVVAMVGCETPTGALESETGFATDAGLTARASAGPERAVRIGRQLAAAREGTARYRRLENALADGYVDIDVVVPGMGRHFLNPGLVDAKFDPARPEILVYSQRGDRMRLVAVEYAVPLTEDEPEGFTGDADVWDGNTDFGLWLLHAWVWMENPDGVFAGLNPRLLP